MPLDKPVRLVLSSEDVIHSLFIPAFRVKRDAVPGRYSKVWFTATRPGEYDLFCAEYCGTSHSDMRALVVVQSPAEYDTWLADASDFLSRMAPADAGKLLAQRRGCNQCHSTDGTAGTGPSFKDLFGEQVKLADGSSVTADENYIRESILDPTKKVVSGLPARDADFPGQTQGRRDPGHHRVLKDAESYRRARSNEHRSTRRHSRGPAWRPRTTTSHTSAGSCPGSSRWTTSGSA